MSTASSDPNAQSPASAPGPHADPGDQEETYFEGSPPLRALAGTVLLCCLVSIAFIALAVLLIREHVGPWWLILSVIIIALLIPVIPRIMSKSRRYRITNYRIDYETGLLAKNIDTVELWHVEDLHFHQSILNRILDVGTIKVISKDESKPIMDLKGIPNPRPLYDIVKQRVIAVKRQRGVIKMDPG